MNEIPTGVVLLYGGPGQGKTVLLISCLTEYGKYGATFSIDVTGDIERGLRAEMPASQRIAHVKSQADIDELASGGWFGDDGIRRGTHVIVSVKQISLASAVNLWKANAFLRGRKKPRRERFIAVATDEAETVFGLSTDGGVDESDIREGTLVARNENRAVIVAAKRPTRIPAYVRSTAIHVCVFKLSSDADARAVEELAPSALFESRETNPQYLSRGKYLYFGAQVHSPDSELETYDGRDDVPPWLVDARAHFKTKRK